MPKMAGIIFGVGHLIGSIMTNKTTRKIRMESYVTVDERDHIKALAGQLNISMSEVIRRLAIGAQLPDAGRYQAVRDMVRVNADLARLGNLLKLGIDEESLDPSTAMDLLGNIRTRQAQIAAILEDM